MSDVEQSEFYASAPSYCVHLSEARKQKQWALEQVSEKLKVPSAYLQALEDGAIDRLPNIAFARGYLRSYARLLGLDADQLIAEFNEVCNEQERGVSSIDRMPHQEHVSSPYSKLIVWFFALVVAGSSVWWWQFQTGTSEQPLGESAVTTPEQVNQSAAVTSPPAADAIPESEVLDSQSSEPVEEASVDEQEPVYLSEEEVERLAKQLDSAEEPESVSAETASTSVAPLLKLSFTAECWLSIETTDGTVIFADLMQPGETLERELSSLPVQLLVGQVTAVDAAQFKGRDLVLADYARQGVARLTLE